MGDHDHDSAARTFAHREHVQRWCDQPGEWLVDDQDRRVAQQGARERQAALLAAGLTDAAMPSPCRALRQLAHDLTRRPRRARQIVVARVGPPDNRFAHGLAEQQRSLQAQAEALADAGQLELAQIAPVDAPRRDRSNRRTASAATVDLPYAAAAEHADQLAARTTAEAAQSVAVVLV